MYLGLCFSSFSDMCLMFSWGYYRCAAGKCMGSLHLFWQDNMFFSDTWIGSNDLMVGSVWVTDQISETRACQQWGRFGSNETVGNGNIVQACILSLKLSKDTLQSIIDLLLFLVKDFGSQSLTISAQSLLSPFGFFDVMLHTCPAQFHRGITNRFWKCWGWSSHSWCRGSTTTTTTTTSSSAKLAPGPTRHGLIHLRILILGEVGLATMQGHGNVLLLLSGCGYCFDMKVAIFLIDITSSFCIIQCLLVSLDFFHNMMG